MSEPIESTDPTDEARSAAALGVAYTTGAFVLWGLAPIYWKAIAEVAATEVLAHRVIWSGLLLLGYLGFQRRLGGVGRLARSPRAAATLALTTVLISFNWGLYIWAVMIGRIVETSLGYFINPLVNVLFGMLFLGERLRRAQWLSIGLATAGVVLLVVRVGTLPWVSLALAISFALYALLRKQVDARPEEGLALETWLVAPLALGYLLTLAGRGELGWGRSLGLDLLLAGTGLLTTIPLVWFTHGARRLPLSTVGILQYIAPTMQFLLAVFVYREPFDRDRLASFGLIWLALALFTWDLQRAMRRPSPPRSQEVTAATDPT